MDKFFNNSNAALLTFAVYILAVFLLAILSGQFRKKKSFLSEYFLGSRSLGMWAFALTFAATASSGGSFIGFPSLVYTHGWSLALWIGSYMLVPLVAMGLFSKRINQFARKSGAITVPDILLDRFKSPTLGLISTVLIVFFMIFNLIAQFKAGSVILQTLLSEIQLFQNAESTVQSTAEAIAKNGSVLEYFFGFAAKLPEAGQATGPAGYIVCLLVFTLTVVIYTTYGGFRAVVWTDVLQGFVMVGGIVVMLPLAIWAVNEQGFDLSSQLANQTSDLKYSSVNSYTTLPGPSDSMNGFLPFWLAVSFFFFWTFASASQPSNMVRMMAFKDSKTLSRAIFTVSVYYSLIYFPIVMIFCCARVLLPDLQASDRVMPEMAALLTQMIEMPWLAGLLVAAPFAAVMSTMDSFLLMISSSIVRDIYHKWINPNASEKQLKKLTYMTTLLVGFGAAVAAMNPPQFLQDIIVFTGAGLATCFLVPVAFALYWPRFNRQAAIASMVGGFLIHVVLYAAGWLLNGKMGPATAQNYRQILGNYQDSMSEGWYQFFNSVIDTGLPSLHPFLIGTFFSFVIAIFVCYCTRRPEREIVLKYFYVKK